MAITLRELLGLPRLGLVLRHAGGEGALDATVHWVHQSELADSSLFTEPGEVLMTTGSHLPVAGQVAERELADLADQYVQRLRDSSVVGLGFGVGVHHDTTPPALLAAAERYGLPAFEIPYQVPFSAVIKAVSKSRSDAEHAYLRRTNSAQRRLIAAAGRPAVARAVVTSTAQILEGWAALADAGGELVAWSHTDQRAAAQRAAAEHRASGQTVSFPGGGNRVCAHSVTGQDGVWLGTVIAGTAADAVLDPFAISTCMLAANLLSVQLSLAGRLETALSGLRGLVMAEVLAGNAELARRAVGVLWPAAPAEPVVLGCVDGPATELARLAQAAPPAQVRGLVGDRLWLVAAAEQAPLLAARLAAQPQLVSGFSQPVGWAGLADARHQALAALLTGSATPQVSVVELLPPGPAAAFARARLGALVQPEAADLLATLRAWLECDGSNDRTAAALGLHRHTVRRRIERIERLLEVELASAECRHELWFACRLASADADAVAGR